MITPMRTQKLFLCRIFIALSMMAICSPLLEARQPTVARLDGSKMTFSQIDSTVTRLMEVILVSSVLVTVPCDAWVTVFSFDFPLRS